MQAVADRNNSTLFAARYARIAPMMSDIADHVHLPDSMARPLFKFMFFMRRNSRFTLYRRLKSSLTTKGPVKQKAMNMRGEMLLF